MNPCMGFVGWIAGAAMFGKLEEEAKAALDANVGIATAFPTPEQTEAIEGYRQVGPC